MADAAHVLARRVRDQRQGRNWTIDQLVERSGVSKGAIVAVENGSTNPSLSTMARIADALGVSISTLFEDDEPERVQVVSIDDLRPLWRGPLGGEAVLITTIPASSPVELWQWRLKAGERYETHPHPAGFRESLTVLSGVLELTAGREVRRIGSGSTAVFEAAVEHVYAAPDGDTTFLMTVHLVPLAARSAVPG